MRYIKNSWLKSLITGIAEYGIGQDYVNGMKKDIGGSIDDMVKKAKEEIDSYYYQRLQWLRDQEREIKGEHIIDEVVARIIRKQLK